MTKIYTASYDISNLGNFFYTNHLYLVKDADGNLSTTNDQEIIRGYAEHSDLFDVIWNNFDPGKLIVDWEKNSFTSPDGLLYDPNNDGILNTDKNGDGNPDTTLDRNYFEVELNGQDADTVWASMASYANALNGMTYNYDLLSRNCVTVVASLFATHGINFVGNVYGLDYTGQLTILGTDGNETFKSGFGAGVFYGQGGIDTFDLSDQNTAASVNLLTGVALSSGTDTLFDIENVLGSDYNDSITGNASANTLNGRNGSDTLNGNGGSDTLIGGDGADSFVVDVNAGGSVTIIETIADGDDDTLVINGAGGGITWGDVMVLEDSVAGIWSVTLAGHPAFGATIVNVDAVNDTFFNTKGTKNAKMTAKDYRNRSIFMRSGIHLTRAVNDNDNQAINRLAKAA